MKPDTAEGVWAECPAMAARSAGAVLVASDLLHLA